MKLNNINYWKVFIFLILLGIGLLSCRTTLCISSRLDPYATSTKFFEALRKNKQYSAEALSDDVQSGFIDHWMQNHEIVQCESGIVEAPTTVGYINNEGQKWQGDISFACTDENENLYCLRMTNMLVEKRRFGWQVVGWEDILEGTSYQECTSN